MTSPISAAPTARECSGQSVVLTRTVATGLLVAGLINIVGLLGFPRSAPVERVVAFGISLSLIVAAVVLFGHSFAIAARPFGLSARGEKLGGLTILAVIFSGVAGYAALAIGGAEQLGFFVNGARLRYLHETGGVFFFGVLWLLGIAFGTVAFRRGGGRLNTGLASAAIVLGCLVLIPTVAASIIYGLGLSD
jgi:hypothetical protein